jgi:hypothetical protein
MERVRRAGQLSAAYGQSGHLPHGACIRPKQRVSAIGKRIPGSTRLVVFRFATGQWEDLAKGSFSFPCWSHDSHTVYYIRFTNNPAVMSVRVADHKVEQVIDLKDISLTGFYGASLSLTPDDQPVMTRDSGSMEIFTLDWRTS